MQGNSHSNKYLQIRLIVGYELYSGSKSPGPRTAHRGQQINANFIGAALLHCRRHRFDFVVVVMFFIDMHGAKVLAACGYMHDVNVICQSADFEVPIKNPWFLVCMIPAGD